MQFNRDKSILATLCLFKRIQNISGEQAVKGIKVPKPIQRIIINGNHSPHFECFSVNMVNSYN